MWLQSVMTPFRSNGIKLKVTGIAINGAGQATASWSWQDDNSRPYSVGSTQKSADGSGNPEHVPGSHRDRIRP
jgi:hypothetical protein